MSPRASRFYQLFREYNSAACKHVESTRGACSANPRSSAHRVGNDKPGSNRLSFSSSRSIRHDQRLASQSRTFHTTSRCCLKIRRPKARGPLPSEDTSEFTRAEQMRAVMRCVPHPVVIISSFLKPKNADLIAKIGADHGSFKAPKDESADSKTVPKISSSMTVSSFNTVCLQPVPIVSFNTKVPSRTLDQIEGNEGRFLVSLLNSTGAAAAMAHQFAGAHGSPPATPAYNDIIEHRLGELPGHLGKRLQEGFPGVMARVRCRLLPEESIRVFDHVVLVAEVEKLFFEHGWHSFRSPSSLVYAAGKYRRLDFEEGSVRLLDVNMPQPPPKKSEK